MTTEDKIAEAYERGFFVGTARAKNRVARGLPIRYDDKPDVPYTALSTPVDAEVTELRDKIVRSYFEMAKTDD